MAPLSARTRSVETHGGVWQEPNAHDLLHRGVLDFSVNVNPYAPPVSVRRVLQNAGDFFGLYPDPKAGRITSVLAQNLGVPRDTVLVGGGATELLFDAAAAYVRKGTRVVVPRHTYGEYEANARAFGGNVKRVPMPDLRLDVDGLAGSLVPGSVCFVCNPNNPTGEYVRLERLRPLLCRGKDAGALVVVDEALADFVRPRDNLVPLAVRSTSLLLVRSFTKVIGLPGVRLGYAVGHPQTVRRLRRFRLPWSVTVLAEKLGEVALREKAFVERSAVRIARERERLSRKLGPFPSDANFLLLSVGDAKRAKRTLLRRAICVRDCTSFGLPRYIRVAVRRPEENDTLIDALHQSGLVPS